MYSESASSGKHGLYVHTKRYKTAYIDYRFLVSCLGAYDSFGCGGGPNLVRILVNMSNKIRITVAVLAQSVFPSDVRVIHFSVPNRILKSSIRFENGSG